MLFIWLYGSWLTCLRTNKVPLASGIHAVKTDAIKFQIYSTDPDVEKL